MNVFTPQVVALAGLDAGSAAAGAVVAALIAVAAWLVRRARRSAGGRSAAEYVESGGRIADGLAEAGLHGRSSALEHLPDPADIPVVDSSTDEIPDGLVLLPAPPPFPRWRGVALATTGTAFSALALFVLADRGNLVRTGGDSALGGALERSSVAFDDEVARDRPLPTPEPAATTREQDQPAAVAAGGRERAQSRGADEAASEQESTPTAVPAAPEAEQAPPSEGPATPAPTSAQPASPPADTGGGPAGSQPDLSQTIENVGGLIGEVTDGIESLPLPSLPRP